MRETTSIEGPSTKKPKIAILYASHGSSDDLFGDTSSMALSDVTRANRPREPGEAHTDQGKVAGQVPIAAKPLTGVADRAREGDPSLNAMRESSNIGPVITEGQPDPQQPAAAMLHAIQRAPCSTEDSSRPERGMDGTTATATDATASQRRCPGTPGPSCRAGSLSGTIKNHRRQHAEKTRCNQSRAAIILTLHNAAMAGPPAKKHRVKAPNAQSGPGEGRPAEGQNIDDHAADDGPHRDACPDVHPESPGKSREAERENGREGCCATPRDASDPLYSQPLAGPPVRGGGDMVAGRPVATTPPNQAPKKESAKTTAPTPSAGHESSTADTRKRSGGGTRKAEYRAILQAKTTHSVLPPCGPAQPKGLVIMTPWSCVLRPYMRLKRYKRASKLQH